MDERYCSPEVAKLLKAKGFEIPTFTFYDDEGKFNRANTVCNWNGTSFNTISCPTHQMALDWLREIHGIDIIVFHEKLPNDCYWARVEKHPYTEYQQEPIHQTYGEAVEDALKYSLENLI